MDADESFLRKYFPVVAKPVMLILLYYAVIVWFCSFLWFAFGDPRQLLISPGMPSEVRIEQLEIVKDYGTFLGNMLRWNFGRQLNPGSSPVLPELLWRMNWTFILIGFSTAAWVLVGAVFTVIASVVRPKKRRPLTLAHSLNGFFFGLTPFIALILLYILSLQLGLFPRAGIISVNISQTPLDVYWHMDFLAHSFLPALTLACVNAVRIALTIWSSTSSFQKKSRMKTLLFSITTIDFKFIISAAIFVEVIFAFPGVNQWFLSGLTQNNWPAVIASFIALLTIATALGLVSTVLDLLQISTGIREELETQPLRPSALSEKLHNKIRIKHGLTRYFKRRRLIMGLAIIIFFIVLAVSAPFVTSHGPATQLKRPPRVAMRYAAPDWFRIFPNWSDANPTDHFSADLKKATLDSKEGLVQVDMDKLKVNFASTADSPTTASVTFDLGTFNYSYGSPQSFTMCVSYNMTFEATGVKVFFIVKNYTAYPTWRFFKDPSRAEMEIGSFTPLPPRWIITNFTRLTPKRDSYTASVVMSLYNMSKIEGAPPNPAPYIFPEAGVYGMQVKFEFFKQEVYDEAQAELYFTEANLTIWGRVHGILGADFFGNDVWTEVVYGTRTIIMFGFGLAALAVVLGLPFGFLAGKFKGWTDKMIMIVAETILFIPLVPFLLIYSRFPYLPFISGWSMLLWFLPSVTLIAFRNSYMMNLNSDKDERSKVYSLLKFSLANFLLTIISVSFTLESIAFLGFGDPNRPSWGRLLYHTYQLGGMNYWWIWIAPVGFSLLFILGLLLVASTLEENHHAI